MRLAHSGQNSRVACRLQGTISSLSDTNTAEYLRQLTDAYRLHLFDIVMQYRAIFSDIASDESGADNSGTGGKGGGQDGGERRMARVLFSWAQHRMQLYLEQMQQLLPMCALRLALAV